MLYLVKFIYQCFILPPGIFIIALILLSVFFYYKKQRRAALIIAGIAAVFYVNSTLLWSDFLIRPLEQKYKPPAFVSGDVIVILGGGATLDTPNLNSKGHLLGSAANRLLTGVQLYHRLKTPLIYSGGQVFRTTGVEAEIARSILLDLQIPKSKIILEKEGLNTTGNAFLIAKILAKYNFRRPVLVTSAFHMPRAVKEFQRAGVNVIPYPSDYQANTTNGFDFFKLIPMAEALNKESQALKEYLGLLVVGWHSNYGALKRRLLPSTAHPRQKSHMLLAEALGIFPKGGFKMAVNHNSQALLEQSGTAYPKVVNLSAKVQKRINAEMKRTAYKALPAWNPGTSISEVQSGYSTMLNMNGVLSLRFQNYYFPEKAAHGVTGVSSVTIDLYTGRVYRFPELFRPGSGFQARLTQIIQAQIRAKQIPLLKPYPGVGLDEDYYLTPDSLVIYYEPDVYTPGYVGVLEFTIAYSQIKELINPRGPIGRILVP